MTPALQWSKESNDAAVRVWRVLFVLFASSYMEGRDGKFCTHQFYDLLGRSNTWVIFAYLFSFMIKLIFLTLFLLTSKVRWKMKNPLENEIENILKLCLFHLYKAWVWGILLRECFCIIRYFLLLCNPLVPTSSAVVHWTTIQQLSQILDWIVCNGCTLQALLYHL